VTITEFLTARLAEDEAAANEIHRPRDCGSVDRDGEFDPDPIWCGCGYPARMLREVQAKRAIIATHGPDPLNHFGSPRSPLCLVCLTDREGYEELWEADPWPCLTLRAIAAAWSDHPDYRPDWKLDS
jgi:hypothetical protein